MDPFSWAVLGLGAANMVRGMAKEKGSKNRAATAMEWSPWTGMQPEQVQESNPFGDMAGMLAMYQGSQQAALDAADRKDLNNRLLGIAEKQAGISPGTEIAKQVAPVAPIEPPAPVQKPELRPEGTIDTNWEMRSPVGSSTAWLQLMRPASGGWRNHV